MNEVLLSETLGEDTTTQLYRDPAGDYRIRVMVLPADGGEQVPAHSSPHVFHDRAVGAEEARAFYGASAAKRHVPAEQAFPGGTA